MIIVNYQKKNHKAIIRAAADALRAGKTVVFPTDTSYGLAADATNIEAIRRLYAVKGREYKKPIHVVLPSLAYGRKIVRWDGRATRLVRQFWPGALTLVLPLEAKTKPLQKLSAGTGFLGVRMPKNKIAADLAKALRRPITATSANVSGQPDIYRIDDLPAQYRRARLRPDVAIDAGKLPLRRPSTVLKITAGGWELLRPGPVSETKIHNVLP